MKQRKSAQRREARRRRIRAAISGTSQRPRVAVFRSNRHLFVQLIDDSSGRTLVSASDGEGALIPAKGKKIMKPAASRISVAERVGEIIGKQALEKHIERAVFDRGGYRYHGIVKAVAEGARRAGLAF